jgi:hypothetical protein
VQLSFWVRPHTAEIDEDFDDAIADLEAQLHPDNPLIEARVMVGKPVAVGMRPNERLIYWAKSWAHRPLSTEMVQTPDGWVLACGDPSTSGG